MLNTQLYEGFFDIHSFFWQSLCLDLLVGLIVKIRIGGIENAQPILPVILFHVSHVVDATKIRKH